MRPHPLPHGAADRVYLVATDVARACGLSLLEIETRLRPADWASPRDFLFTGRGLLYAETSLFRLADAFHAAGAHDAAISLRTYAARIASAPPRGDPAEAGTPVAVDPVSATADEANARIPRRRRHASDREAVPHSWAHDWEAAHE